MDRSSQESTSPAAADQGADAARSPAEVPRRRRFSLAQLLACMFVLGVLLAAARLIVILPSARLMDWAVVILGFVAATVLFEVVRLRWAAQITAIFGASFFLVAAMLPAVSSSRQAAMRVNCSDRLKQIAVALHSYHEQYGSLPPAVVRDPSGRPLHSWRVLLLPYLEEGKLYAQYRFDEPWDGPNNRRLHRTAVAAYVCPSEKHQHGGTRTETSYVVVAGPRTAFPDDRWVALSDITDAAGDTILVVEIESSGIHWLEPRDLHVTQMTPRINAEKGQGPSSLHAGGVNAVMVDGNLRFLPDSLPPATLERLLTIDGGEQVVWGN